MAPSLIMSTQQIEQIANALEDLQSKTRANYAFLVDVSGQLIQARGRTGSTDMGALAALIAGNIAATREIARRISEPTMFRVLLHEGAEQSVYVSHVGDRFMLVVVFAANIQIGLVRLLGKRAADELTTLTSKYESATGDVPSVLESELGAFLDHELDRWLPN